MQKCKTVTSINCSDVVVIINKAKNAGNYVGSNDKVAYSQSLWVHPWSWRERSRPRIQEGCCASRPLFLSLPYFWSTSIALLFINAPPQFRSSYLREKTGPWKNCSLLCTSSTYGTQQDSLAHNPQSRRGHAFLNLDIYVGIVSISTQTLAHNPQSRREHAFVKSHISM